MNEENEETFEFRNFLALMKYSLASLQDKTTELEKREFNNLLVTHVYYLPLSMALRPDRVQSIYQAVYQNNSVSFQLNTLTSIFYSNLNADMVTTLIEHVEMCLAIDGPLPALSIIPKSFRDLCPVSITENNSVLSKLIGLFKKRKTNLHIFLENNKMFIILVLLTLLYWITPNPIAEDA